MPNIFQNVRQSFAMDFVVVAIDAVFCIVFHLLTIDAFGWRRQNLFVICDRKKTLKMVYCLTWGHSSSASLVHFLTFSFDGCKARHSYVECVMKWQYTLFCNNCETWACFHRIDSSDFSLLQIASVFGFLIVYLDFRSNHILFNIVTIRPRSNNAECFCFFLRK